MGMTLREWAEQNGVNQETAKTWLRRGRIIREESGFRFSEPTDKVRSASLTRYAEPIESGHGGWGVYFLENCGYVKVGYSNDVDSRLKKGRAFLLSERILGVVACESEGEARECEAAFHSQMSRYHWRGEWFTLTPALEESIISMLKLKRSASATTILFPQILNASNDEVQLPGSILNQVTESASKFEELCELQGKLLDLQERIERLEKDLKRAGFQPAQVKTATGQVVHRIDDP